MKKIFSYIFMAGTACSFSFRKMECSGVYLSSFGYDFEEKPELNFVSDINQIDDKKFNTLYEIISTKETKSILAYIYDPVSKYGFTINPDAQLIDYSSKELCFQKVKHEFDLLKGNTFSSVEEAKESFGVLIKDQNLLQAITNGSEYLHYNNHAKFMMHHFKPSIFFIDSNEHPECTKGIKHLIQKHKQDANPLCEFIMKVYELPKHSSSWLLSFKSELEIFVMNTTKGVKVMRRSKDNQCESVDFQKALGKYLEKQNPLDDFAQPLVKIIFEGNYEDGVQGNLAVEVVRKVNKLVSLEKQRDLVNNSEILTIRCMIHDSVPAKIDPDNPPLKCTIIGTAIDKRNLTTYHWVTELDRELNCLFGS